MINRIGRVTAVGLIFVLLTVVLVAGLFLDKTKAEPLDTYHSGWHLIRETATEDGANFAAVYALATSEGDFANKDSSTVLAGGPFKIPTTRSQNYGEGHSAGSRWQFAICGGISDDDTASFNLIGWSKDNGMLQVICEGDVVLGTQDVVLYPDDSAAATGIFWVDTINLDETTKWPKRNGDLAGTNVYNSGDNEVCILEVALMGIEWIQFVFYDCGGAGTEMNNITVYGRRY